jgi:release factor glutamine methyltransferase
MSETREIRTLIDQVTERLLPVSETPRLEADLLVARAINMPRSYLFAHPDDELDDGALGRLNEEVQRRLAGEPLAYISGMKEFWSLELMVTRATLVPRPETEKLVELALAEIPRQEHSAVLDLGTGSGAIACAIAWERRMAHVTGVDVSADAIAVAEQNARQLDLDNLRFIQGSWIEPVSELRYPVVVSNPPYVAARDPALAALRWEPRGALVAPEAGLGCIRLLAETVPRVLTDDGVFLFEHGADQADAVQELLAASGWVDTETFPDLAGLPRVTRARRGRPAVVKPSTPNPAKKGM